MSVLHSIVWQKVATIATFYQIYRGLEMTEQEVYDIVKLYGWSFLRRRRRSRSYVYAARKMQGKRKEVYIGSIGGLAQLTLDQLTTKLRDKDSRACR